MTAPYPQNEAAPYGYSAETGAPLTEEEYDTLHPADQPEAVLNATGYDPTTGKANPDSPPDAEFYCPGCGGRFEYRQKCTGTIAPHPPIEVVPTAELAGDPSGFTAAPNTD